jgi:hypothetical protein
VKAQSPGAGTTTTWRFSAGGAVAEAWPDAEAALRCSLSFASCYVYAPRGEGFTSAAARLLCQRVKASDPRWLPRYAGQVAELCARERERPFASLFARDAWLVPVPGCAPASAKPTAACQLAVALHELGLGCDVWLGITRRTAVTRSATAQLGARPTVRQHYESFAISAASRPPARIVLVDDVITKGRTLLAAAARLRGAFPHADVRAFAMVRSLGFSARPRAVARSLRGMGLLGGWGRKAGALGKGAAPGLD